MSFSGNRTSYLPAREEARECAERLDISLAAAELFGEAIVIDLHVDSFIWQRILGYDIGRLHGRGALGGRFYSQVDLPRLSRVGINGATWVITTNPFRSARARARVFATNLEQLSDKLNSFGEQLSICRTATECREAISTGKHAAFLGVQGGNALDVSLDAIDGLEAQALLRITLVHLNSSRLGRTSTPELRRSQGLSSFGREYIAILNAKRIFVDLAHIHPTAFFQALEVHDRTLAPIVTHTGVSGVHQHWRNLNDEQLRAIANRGGIVGIMYHAPYLGDGFFGGKTSTVVDHIDHVIRTVGEDFVALGSDWDGAIVTPREMPTCLELPRLVQEMLNRGYSDVRIRKVLAENFLRVLYEFRG